MVIRWRGRSGDKVAIRCVERGGDKVVIKVVIKVW